MSNSSHSAPPLLAGAFGLTIGTRGIQSDRKEQAVNIIVGGASGLIGAALVDSLTAGGHDVVRLVRGKRDISEGEILWDPLNGVLDGTNFEGTDAVVHLSGENVAEGRWTAEKKARLWDSRVKSTQLLCERLSSLERPPRVWLCASAIGYYGSRGDAILDEDSGRGDGFLVELCEAWEAATAPAAARGIRVVNLRFGMVLSGAGGPLQKMLLPFKLGLGGVLGDGKQYVSWVAIDDVTAAIGHILVTGTLAGPVNVLSPNPVTNYELTKTLGKVLSRPTVLPIPAFAARLVFGEMADGIFMASVRAAPKKLLESGFIFKYPQLEGALRHVLR